MCCPFLIASRLSPIAYRLLRFFIALSLSLYKSVSMGLSIACMRADSCPLHSLVSELTQHAINLNVRWLNLSSSDRLAALSMTPHTAPTSEFYAEHSSWRHAMPEKFRINFTMRQKSVSYRLRITYFSACVRSHNVRN